MKKFALLFAGCVNQHGWKKRYENDLGFMFNVLSKNNYEQIFVLYYDGSVIEFNGEAIKTFPGTLDYYGRVIEYLKKKLMNDDQLLIFVSNHGTSAKDSETQAAFNLPDGETSINCFLSGGISLKQVESDMNLIKGKKIIVLGQCFGGDFINCNISNSIIMSANIAGEVSFACFDKEYDEFLYHFTSFLNGRYPDGSELNNVHLSSTNILDAFMYAKENNFYCAYPGTKFYSDSQGNPLPMVENPQISINLDNAQVYTI